jgi:hypothetical protein
MEYLLRSKRICCGQTSDTLELIWSASRDIDQWVSPGPVPLAIIIRPRISEATAVAARIVKNQYRRFPRRKEGSVFLLGCRSRSAAAIASAREACEAGVDLAGLPVRRCGDIQGQIV